jgi:hypothetical protein
LDVNNLKRSLEDLIDDTWLPNPPSIEELRKRTGRRGLQVHRPRRLLAGIVTTLVVISGAALAVAYGPRSSTTGSNHPATQTTPVPDVIGLGPQIAQPTVLAASNGKLWVSGYTPDQRDGPLLEFDAATGKLLSTIRLPNGGPFQIVAAKNTIWMRTQQGEASTHLVKIDARTHRVVANVRLSFDGGLAVTKDAVWTVDGPYGLRRIDPRTGHTIATIPLPGGRYGPLSVTAGPLGVFLGNPYDGGIWRVNTQTNTVSLVTHIGTAVGQMFELGASLWVPTGTALVDLPVSTGIPGRTIELGAPILSVSSDGHYLWVTTDMPKPGAFRVDPTSGEITPITLPANVAHLFAIASEPVTGTTWAATMLPIPSLVHLTP